MTTTPQFGMTHTEAGQIHADRVHNESIQLIDAIMGRGVQSRATTTPPTHEDGLLYIIPSGATGDWAAIAENTVVLSRGGEWVELTPDYGWSLYVVDEDVNVYWNGTAWTTMGGGSSAEDWFAGRRTTNLTLNTTGTGWQGIGWDAEDRKNAGFTHDTGTNPEQITIVEAGDYEVEAQVQIESISGGGIRGALRITLDATLVTGSQREAPLHHSASIQRNLIAGRWMLPGVTAGQVLRIEGAITLGADGNLRVLGGQTAVTVRRVQ